MQKAGVVGSPLSANERKTSMRSVRWRCDMSAAARFPGRNMPLATVKNYWEGHTLGLQYVKAPDLRVGTAAFFAHIRPWMNPYKFPEIMPRIERQAALLKGKHILEVGCGMGFDTLEFLKRGVRVTATDLTQAAVDIAKRHFEVAGYRPEAVHTADVLDLAFPDNTFDGVWACGVVHHTGNTAKAIREIHRVLKPGGRAMISHI